jgi:plasmid stability protein
MANLKVRKVEDWVYQTHKERAAKAGRSLEEELREALRASALGPKREMAHRTAIRLLKMLKRHGVMPSSTPGIRAAREKRG